MSLQAIDLEGERGQKLAALANLRAVLAEKFPASPSGEGAFWPTGLESLDAQHGGLQRGVVTELAGSLGGSSLFIDAMLHAVRRDQTFMGLIDGARSFDPESRGPDLLPRLLLVLCDSVKTAIKVADLLLRDGNLSLLLLDLQMLPLAELRRIPPGTWHRFQRLVEQTSMAFVVFTPQPMVEGARMRLTVRNRWTLQSMIRRRHELLRELDVQAFRRSGFGSGPSERPSA